MTDINDSGFPQFAKKAYFTAFAGAEEDEELLEHGGGTKSAIGAVLQPVDLDKDLYKAFNSTLFARRRSAIVETLAGIGKVAVGVNNLFMFMRYLLNEGNRLNVLEQQGERELQNFVNEKAIQVHTAMAGELDEDFDIGLTAHLQAIIGDSKMYMRDSQVYGGGIDIVTRHNARDMSLVGANLGNHQKLPTTVDQYNDYEGARLGQYSTRTALAVIRAAEKIIHRLFPKGTDIEESTFEVDYDYVVLQTILENELGFNLPVQFLTNLTMPKIAGGVPEMFIRTALVLERAGASKLYDELRNSLIAGEYPIDHVDKARERIASQITAEGKILSGRVGGSLVLTLNKPLCEFISQSVPMSKAGVRNWYRIWVTQYLRGKNQRSSTAVGKIRNSNIPRYSLPISAMKNVTSTRKQLGMVTEESRTNKEGVFLSTSGTLTSMPPMSEREEITPIVEYERIQEEISELCLKYSVTPSVFTSDVLHTSLLGITKEDVDLCRGLMTELKKFSGTLLGYDWDYGVAFYADANGEIEYDIEHGATRPQNLSIADLLGYNMARPGEEVKIRCASEALVLATEQDPNDIKDVNIIYGSPTSPTSFTLSSLYEAVLNTYTYYTLYPTAEGELLPKLQDLVFKALEDLGITDLDSTAPFFAGENYKALIEANGSLKEGHAWTHKDPLTSLRFTAREMLRIALISCSGQSGSALYRTVVDSGIPSNLIVEEIKDHEMYFMFSESPLSKLKTSLYRTIGGNIYAQMVKAIQGLSFKTINQPAAEGVTRSSVRLPSPKVILSTVKPVATLMGEYVENYEALSALADNEIKSIERDSGIDVDDVNFAGGSDSFAMFPHQVDTQRYLRKPEPPAFAVLDISPGGGKTSIGIVDAACIVDDMQKIGKRIRPLVICPDGLIRNWCDDTTQFTEGKWNVIPINTSTVRRWGYDKMIEMIRNAPVNTLCVVGMQFLSNNTIPVVYGNASVTAGLNVEMMKAIGFNYIVIDESHKLKKLTSIRHRMVKQLTTASFVDYLRIATGTLISDRITDIEGQVALFQPNIFRKKELRSTISTGKEGTEEEVELWKVSSAKEARTRLSRYAAVVTKAKKEWAFMLPSPIEKFHAINMEGTNETEENTEYDRLHAQLYEIVLQESIEELQKASNNAKRRTKGDDDDDGDDNDMSEDRDVSEGGDVELGEGDFAGVDPSLLDIYLQRIERLIIAPEEDPAYTTVFGDEPIEYHSRKSRYISHLIQDHFNVPKWEKGKQYSEYDLVSHEGDNYVSHKYDTGVVARLPLPTDVTGIPPDVATDYWRKEPGGKVLIFCRYTASVEAVFNALSTDLQEKAVKFTDKEDNKWGNLEAFKSDPNVQILIANEQGMSEGHNLQMASRMIRVESPWGPGELDQSASRIFRPDPKGAKAGAIYREVVFLDWVCVNNTMEVPKMARLIAKVFDSVRFDEGENPRYDEVLNVDLPEVGLSIEHTLQVRSALSDYSDYTENYASLNGVIRNEFAEMRATQPREMVPVPPTEEVPGSAIMKEIPFIPAQKIADRRGWKPEPLSILLQTPSWADRLEDPSLLVGTPVLTDMGTGMIVGASVRYLKDDNNRNTTKVDPRKPMSSLKVRIKVADGEPDLIIDLKDIGLAYIPTNISASTIREEFEVSTLTRAADIRRAEREAKRIQDIEDELEAKQAAKDKREADTNKRIRIRAKDKQVADGNAKQRKANLKEGKPINTGITRDSKPKLVQGVGPVSLEDEVEAMAPLTLRPTYYHGYLTLETDDMEYAKELKKLKFREFGAYVYVDVKRRNQANKVMDYIEDNFDLSDATAERLGAVFKSFAKGARALYQLELAPSGTMPHFFAVRRVMVKNKKEARIYPMFKDDTLSLVCDLRTCPIMKKHIGKTIPGAATKWQLSNGNMMAFVRNKSEMKELVRKIHNAGIAIANRQELLKEITGIRFKAATKKK